jgi:RNA polymerase sigma factor (sigma-70 family)
VTGDLSRGNDVDDSVLLQAMRDPVLFAGLVPRHGPPLHAYLARRAPAVADDLLGEVWLAAYASRTTFDPSRGSGRAWLFGVARHVLHAHYERVATASRRVTFAPDGPLDEWAAVDERLDAAASGPALREALARLPAVEREVLLLVAWEGLTPTEAAQVVGVPPGTARSRLHRARTQMRRHLPATTGPLRAAATTVELS